nr:MAG TPA: Protein recA [Bacteriophage sp.]
MAGQPLKKKEVKKFDIKDFKKNFLGEKTAKAADKEMEWIVMPPAFQEAIKLPGFLMGRTHMLRGWSDTGKSTLKNLAVASAMRQGIMPVIFETEGNFDFSYARDCGMDITPVYGDVVNEETGETERGIVDWEGNYMLFTPTKICEFCGKMDYTQGKETNKQRKVAVIEDIGYIINTLLDAQDDGDLPMPLLFVWDSVGSIISWKSYQSKVGNNMFDANAINNVFKPIFPRISASKEVGSPYTNTMIVINKIWKDTANSVGGAVAIANSGGEAFQYGVRLQIHVGGVAKAGVKKLKAIYKGEEYQYGTVTKIAVCKNQLPTPYNITYSGTMCCVHNGIISEDEIDNYKKTEIPKLIKKKLESMEGKDVDVDINDIKFSEEGKVDMTPVPTE